MNEKIQDIFSRNEVIGKTAFLNWRIERGDSVNLFNLGNGYIDAALQSLSLCECLRLRSI